VSSWTVKEHSCKVLSFLHVPIVLYDLNHHLLTLIIEKILLEEKHI
jgi:hypothetical protein